MLYEMLTGRQLELEALRSAPHAPTTATAATPAPARVPLWKHLLPLAAAIVLTAAATSLILNRWRPAPVRGVVRLSIPAPDLRLTVAGLAVAPGGTAVAYVAATPGDPS